MTTPHPTIGNSFRTQGRGGMEATYKRERWMAAAKSRRNATGNGLRHSIGSLVISLGAFIAGTTTHIQDRQATMPVPTPKTGFVPTR